MCRGLTVINAIGIAACARKCNLEQGRDAHSGKTPGGAQSVEGPIPPPENAAHRAP